MITKPPIPAPIPAAAPVERPPLEEEEEDPAPDVCPAPAAVPVPDVIVVVGSDAVVVFVAGNVYVACVSPLFLRFPSSKRVQYV